jgi:hypothetical protein
MIVDDRSIAERDHLKHVLRRDRGLVRRPGEEARVDEDLVAGRDRKGAVREPN